MSFVDLSTTLCATLLANMTASIDQLGLDQPNYVGEIGGVGPAIADACDGMIWTRIGTMMPTDGSGAQFAAARIGWEIPAWAIPIECGWLGCHQVIDESGGYTSADDETAIAARDDSYRTAWANAIAYLFPDTVADDPELSKIVDGRIISPWQPAGPDGGYSGGIFVVTVVATALAICTD